MSMPVQIFDDIFLIDDFDLGMQERTGTFVIKNDKPTIIETCASPSIPYILKGLADIGVEPEEIVYIIVTHIHLDHAGGAGLLLSHCPNAKVIVHPKGARHLVDPSKLIAGAKAVYGMNFNTLFDPIVPIEDNKIVIMKDKEQLQVGKDRMLTFYDTPGHANHHFSIYDPISKGIFTGDTLGIYYKQLSELNILLFLPSTSPNQFDPEKMLHSAKMIEQLDLKSIYFGHYGMTTNVEEVFSQLHYWLPKFIDAGTRGIKKNNEHKVQAVTGELLTMISTYLHEQGVPENHPIYNIIPMDMSVCAMGIVDYLVKNDLVEEIAHEG
ncbi:MBL fold metallo-hydrolase [Cytobacillus sp. Hm23]